MQDTENAKIPTTIHIDKSILARFKTVVPARKVSQVIQTLMADHVDARPTGSPNERVQLEQAMSLLASAVTQQLLKNRDWAKETLIRAGMGLPGAIVFDRRIVHFSWEKEEMGNRVSRWLLHRASSFLKQGRRVIFICDSGTTVFWFLKALGEATRESVLGLELSRAELSGLRVLTNNIPGAESFVTYTSHNTLPFDGRQTRISDVVHCRLLAGTFLPRYAAVTGPDTNEDLINFCRKERARAVEAAGPGRTTARETGPVFIGLTTGNWVLVPRGGDETVPPQLLARGEGHGAFKTKLLELCDETFVLAPLGKIVLAPQRKDLTHHLKTLNDMLGYSSKSDDPDRKSYELVPTPAARSRTIKLVSTSRTEKSILLHHSALVRDALGDPSILDVNDKASVQKTQVPIGQLDHLMFPFDTDAGKLPEEQLTIELPHEETRTPEFMNKFLNVRLNVKLQ
jgi:hypothetical protein